MSEFGELIAEDTVRFVRKLPGPIDTVWSYLVEAEKRKRWLCGGETELAAGGKVEMHFHNATLSNPSDEAPPDKYKEYDREVQFSGTVTACEPPHKLSHTWDFEGESSEVTYELVASGDDVVLTLTHRKLATPKEVLGVCGGWHTHLEILKEILTDQEPQGFWKRHTHFEGEYEKRLGIQLEA